MPGPGPRLLGLFFLPLLVAADFPPAGDFFRRGLPWSDIYSARSKPSPSDEAQPLEARARAYLDIQCSACHRSGGVLGGSLDLRFETPRAQTGLSSLSGRRGPEGFLARLRPGRPEESELYRRLASTGTDAMPPLGRTSRDEKGLALIRAWIESLPEGPSQPSPSTAPLPPAPDGSLSQAIPAPVLANSGTDFIIPRGGGEPASPPAIRISDARGGEMWITKSGFGNDGAGKGWVVESPGILPRGRYRLDLTWNGRRARRILIVL